LGIHSETSFEHPLTYSNIDYKGKFGCSGNTETRNQSPATSITRSKDIKHKLQSNLEINKARDQTTFSNSRELGKNENSLNISILDIFRKLKFALFIFSDDLRFNC